MLIICVRESVCVCERGERGREEEREKERKKEREREREFVCV